MILRDRYGSLDELVKDLKSFPDDHKDITIEDLNWTPGVAITVPLTSKTITSIQLMRAWNREGTTLNHHSGVEWVLATPSTIRLKTLGGLTAQKISVILRLSLRLYGA